VIAKVFGRLLILLGAALVLYVAMVVVNVTVASVSRSTTKQSFAAATPSSRFVARGRQIFRFDTFGDQAFWGGALQLHRALAGSKNGGVGPGVSPKTALSVGLKVDSTAIPRRVAAAIKAGKVDLDDPKVTLTLLKLKAVVGVRGFFRGNRLTSVGLTCAVCHSTVDNSFAPGVGRRRDGWPNRDLNVGAIVALAPNKRPITDLLKVDEATVNKVLASWGPGKFDAELFLDGKAFRPDGKSAATLIPAAFGLQGINLHTYTGWGSVPYWNAFVANLEMHGVGNFDDDRLGNAQQFPVAARAGFAHVRNKRDLITPKLGALHLYQLSLPVPHSSKFNRAAARRGRAIFNGKGRCANCHMPPAFSDAGWNLHPGEEICIDNFQSSRSPTFRYRTTPLRGIVAKLKGGFYHDGRFPTLRAVVDHYDSCFKLGLSSNEKTDLLEYLRGR
jgi:hypothetical protein